MPDIYDLQVLNYVVNSLQIPPTFLMTTFFPTVITATEETISFDVASAVRKIAPFVSPLVEGKIVREQGFVTKSFKPAYIKMKTPLDAEGSLKRTIGEPITGNLTPQQRNMARVNNTLSAHRTMIEARMEVMASEILRTGAVTVVGDGYPETLVSYGRDAALSVTLSGGSRWGQTGISPLANLQTWASTVLQKSGSSARTVVLDLLAWNLFKEDANVQKRLEIQRPLSDRPSMRQDAVTMEGATYMGMIDNFEIWVYAGEYVNDAGQVTKILPDNTVLMVGQMEGIRHFGAIHDEEAGLQALPYFSKSWVEKDPSRRMVLTQSAPLLVPYRPNATLRATVN